MSSSPRNPPPPPPPPPHLRSWPDRAALLADRDRAMGELGRRMLGGARLTLFLLWLVLLQFGWSLVGAALVSLDDSVDVISAHLAVLAAAAGLGALVPAAFFLARGVRRDRTARERFVQWALLDRDPVRDARHREPVLSVVWLVLPFLMCAAGLWICVAVPATARPGSSTYAEVAYGMGAGIILWVAGLIGVTKAVTHYRLAVRLFGVSARRAGRSASSARPTPG
ncbi:hypothetical protein ACFPM3_29810 [Streptomyces coeruleoprunus]|uniref:Uncharacterized protein n=1 Tax=Streptomyces coeruleoprunus TaxID=285563 RepID=A0ABV9XMN6_9ACTN